MQLPRDPMLLMSLTNTLLRDQYQSLEELCEDREWDKTEITEKLRSAGFEYMPQINQFR